IPYGHGAQLALSLALYGELLQGSRSFWFGYLQSLPRRTVGIAVLWGAQTQAQDEDGRTARAWAVGTEIEKELRGEDGVSLLEDVRKYYDSTVRPLLQKLCDEDKLNGPCTLGGFLHAYSLVSSRAFMVDAYHGLAMVPIADAFNHTQDHHVHLESEPDVCVACGSLAQCSHDMEEEDGATTHGRTLPVTGLEVDTCDMASNLYIPPFTEVFNTYGEDLTNAQLLARYGFMVSDGNEHDVVSWELEELEGMYGEDGGAFRRLYLSLVSAWPRDARRWEGCSSVFQPMRSGLSLVVNGDGKLSHQLWMYCAARSLQRVGMCGGGVPDVLEFLARLADLVGVGDADGDEGPSLPLPRRGLGPPATQLVLTELARTVLRLCSRKAAHLGPQPQMSTAALGEALDGVDERWVKTRWAMMEVLSERSMLECCAGTWEELLCLEGGSSE
ncbi:SET domain-containing protein, partial [Cristinia sonorae]